MTPASIVGTTLVGSSIVLFCGFAEHGAMIAIVLGQLAVGVGLWIGSEMAGIRAEKRSGR